MILLFIRKYWFLIVLGATFYAGYYLRGLQETAAQIHDIIKQSENYNKPSVMFENLHTDIDTLYTNINTKVTYEDTYSCIIPANGLQLLRAATY